MAMTRYQVMWITKQKGHYHVSLEFDPGVVELAKTDGIKGAHAKLTICRRVRGVLSARYPELLHEPVYFNDLVIDKV